MKLLRYIFFFLCAGCINDADIDIPEKRKPVVYGAISPEADEIIIEVYLSTPTVGTTMEENTGYNSPLTTADVHLIDENTSSDVTLTYDQEKRYFTTPEDAFDITPGHTYKLTVSTEEYGTVTSSTIVPEVLVEHNIKDVDTSTSSSGDNYSGYGNSVKFSMEWAHTYNDDHYFFYDFHMMGEVKNKQTGEVQEDSSMMNFYNTYSKTTDQFLSSSSFNGPHINTGRLGTHYSPSYPEYDGYEHRYSLITSLYLIDEYHYDFFTKASQASSFGDPFMEPFNLNHNIEGGLGIFVAYRKTNQTYVLKEFSE